MKARKKSQRGYPLTADDARVFQLAAEVLEGAWGAGPQRYMHGYLRILSRYHQLKRAGVRVRISGPEHAYRGPFLIIGK